MLRYCLVPNQVYLTSTLTDTSWRQLFILTLGSLLLGRLRGCAGCKDMHSAFSWRSWTSTRLLGAGIPLYYSSNSAQIFFSFSALSAGHALQTLQLSWSSVRKRDMRCVTGQEQARRRRRPSIIIGRSTSQRLRSLLLHSTRRQRMTRPIFCYQPPTRKRV